MSYAELGHSQTLPENIQNHQVANGKQDVQGGQEVGGLIEEEIWDPLSSSCERLIPNENNVQIDVNSQPLNAKIPAYTKKPFNKRKSVKFVSIFLVFLLIIVITFFSVNFHHTKSVKSELRHIKDNHIAGLQKQTADLEERSDRLERLLNQTIQSHTLEMLDLKEHSEIQERLLNQTLLRLKEIDDLKDRSDKLERVMNKTISGIDGIREDLDSLLQETNDVKERALDTERIVKQLQKDRDDMKKITHNLKGEVKQVYELRKDKSFNPNYMRNSSPSFNLNNSLYSFSYIFYTFCVYQRV